MTFEIPDTFCFCFMTNIGIKGNEWGVVGLQDCRIVGGAACTTLILILFLFLALEFFNRNGAERAKIKGL
jgi:hypothetical protein